MVVAGWGARDRCMSTGNDAYEVATHSSIRDIGESVWSRLAGRDAPPFVSFAWLDALEQNDRVTPERGWAPLYITLRRGTSLVAAAPAFVKGNSEGEFVFDHAWAQFAEQRLGIPYYPKLIVAVPFTPATGPRLLTSESASRPEVARAFVAGLRELCEKLELSGAHVLFPTPDEATELADAGLTHRMGIQFHWRNDGYRRFDDFLGRFNAKRRAQIRRERREMQQAGVRFEVLTGSDLSEEIADLSYEFYRSTVDQFFWGRRYLNRAFFHAICERMPRQIHVVLARDVATRRPLAGAFNLLGRRVLYGRYWGALEQRRFLHFNVCYYAGIEECIARGLERFEPGAGGEHKHVRGFEPTLTHSAHLLVNPMLDRVVRDHTARERAAVAEHLATTPRVVRRAHAAE